uniref:glycosyltransferase family 2 protein n=1 Tax=uncultured Sphingomonas sp. TaxID=158754 RepID=UPI0025F09094|nr:glycosyltransferase family 2 protein [uncultured Sphingomonas sp.]
MTAIIPAHNAEGTIDATLASVRAQTHRELEIIVVDDGSTDGTRQRVRSHAAADSRIRLVAQANGGVAAARNRGIAEASAHYLAPVDADDVWHPDKIARQLALIENSSEVGLVCTAYSVLDEQGRVTMESGGSSPRNHQFLDLCERNFIGNGSSALLRRSAIEGCGGYDESLRRQGAQGCEDLKLYLCIAEHHRIEMIRSPLTGYRQLPDNMSSDAGQMLRSFDLVAAEFCRRRPELRARFAAHRTYLICWLAHRALKAQRWRQTLELSTQLFTRPSRALPQAFAAAAGRRVKRLPLTFKRARAAPAETFLEAEL